MALDQASLIKALLEKKLISDKNLKALAENAKAQNTTLEELLFDRESIADEKLGEVVAELYEVPFVHLSDKTIVDSLLRVIPYTLASHQSILPFEQTGEKLKVAMSDPKNFQLISGLEKKTGLDVEVYYSTKKDIKHSLKVYNRDVNQKFTKLLKGVLADPTKIESLKDASKILDTIILFAYQNSASDIHIEPRKDFLIVRYRIDGILQTITELPIAILDLLTTRIKVLANLRTDEHMGAQDGRFKIELENNEITMRVSILPTYDGEKTVLRILSSTNQELNLDALGYTDYNLKMIKRNIQKSHGMILMTGPTGSGKTTTLYSVLKTLNSPEVNISTIEDPVEYRLEGINQIQANPKADLTFATGLRSLLRQDPDIVMVGEIRDEETAGIAINAALTGHLVLATLHTNDAASTLPRMLEMGVEGFLLGATTQMIMAQRLLRVICPKCKKEFKVTPEDLKTLGKKFDYEGDFETIFNKIAEADPALKEKLAAGDLTFYKGEGCGACGGTGFKGRTSIIETMEISDEIKKIILRNGSPDEIQAQAEKEGMNTMFIDGMRKVLGGTTSIEEVLRVMRT